MSGAETMDGCIFCRIANGSAPCMKVYEDEHTMAFLDIARDVDGHILAVPKKHVKSILDCDAEMLSHLTETVRLISKHLTENCGYDGVNLLNASGASAGQSVPHLHVHIIPRRSGDGIDAWPRFDGAKEDPAVLLEKLAVWNEKRL